MSPANERRTEELFAVTAGVDCVFASPVLEDYGKVRVTNISRSGIGLIVSERIAPGMMLAVNLANRVKKFSKVLLVQVAQVTTKSSGVYLVGGIFDSPLTSDELQKLIS